MERKFYHETFEKFLKGHADQFKMTPSKKVWHGIYNDLHPGRRWPSATMSLMFIFTLVVIGHLNTNNERNKVLAHVASDNNAPSLTSKISNNKLLSVKNTRREVKSTSENVHQPGNVNSTPGITLSFDTDNENTNTAVVSYTSTNKQDNVSSGIDNKAISSQKNITNKSTSTEPISIISSDDVIETPEERLIYSTAIINNVQFNPLQNFSDKNLTQNLAQGSAANLFKAKKAKATWTYYISPSISYRNFAPETSSSNGSYNTVSSNQSRGINSSVLHKPMIGLEAGSIVSYNIFKNLQLVSGVQINYSGYIIEASNTHPILGTLILHDEAGQPFAYSDMSHYGNNMGYVDAKLKNYNIQASIPIGLQYQIFGDDNIKFNAIATLQPSFLIASHAYLLSTDKRNYLTDPALNRKWNVSTNFGTFISFRSNSFNWQVGPQIHYQLLSTYSKSYQYKEHLIDYGIRLGVSKILK